MKEVVYRYRIRQAPKLLALAQEATETLNEILGKNAPLVTAEWDRVKGPGNPDLLALTLSGWNEPATRVFEPEEFRSPARREIGLRLLWDDLLEIQTHKQLQELLTPNQAEEGG